MPKIDYPPYSYQPYPKYKYHETHEPVIVETAEEEEYLPSDEWKDSPADFGIITHPSKEQMMKNRLGFNFEELKAKKKAEKAAALRKLTKKAVEETEEEEIEEETEETESSEEKPVVRRNKRK